MGDEFCYKRCSKKYIKSVVNQVKSSSISLLLIVKLKRTLYHKIQYHNEIISAVTLMTEFLTAIIKATQAR
jgi:hypothetical protein